MRTKNKTIMKTFKDIVSLFILGIILVTISIVTVWLTDGNMENIMSLFIGAMCFLIPVILINHLSNED